MKRSQIILVLSLVVFLVMGLLVGCSPQKQRVENISSIRQEQPEQALQDKQQQKASEKAEKTETPKAEPSPSPKKEGKKKADEASAQPSVAPTGLPSKVPTAVPTKAPEGKQPKQPIKTQKPEQTPGPTVAAASVVPKPEPTPTPQIPTCTLSVRCDDVFNHMEQLQAEKRDIIPANGVIFPKQTVSFTEGESVFDVLLRELKQKQIHFEFVNNPMYNSVYIEGIGNLFEFDCGDTSGWKYAVNGVEPRYGCSQYILKNGDTIEFFYRCSIFD